MIDRDVNRGKKPDVNNATRTTFAVSAFWHGFYPSYYTTFFIMWCQIEFCRNFYRVKQNVKIPKLATAITDYVMTMLGFGYALINHWLNDWSKSVKVYQTTYFIPILLPLALSFAFQFSGLTNKSKEKKISPNAKIPLDGKELKKD